MQTTLPKRTSKPMGRPRTFDKEQALDTAMNLFWKYGYDGVTFSMVAEAIGINRSSLQAAFGSKEDLFRAVLQRYMDKPSAYVNVALAVPDTESAVRLYLEGAADNVTEDDTRRGCLATIGASIGPPESEGMRTEVALNRKRAEASLRERLRKGLKKGDLEEGANVSALASFLMTVIYGNVLRAKEGHTRASLQITIDIVMKAMPFNRVAPESRNRREDAGQTSRTARTKSNRDLQ
ncbi:TetR/AcrR family transcriptional regulator [Edaphobacter sp. HDX4]|uniref:TetR/AcrR family transcriptional regulator n=1 Tax=Edaphobacter sp. HDX4 TaxID=2794064 RepID=UPI002FE5ABD4